MFSRGRESRKCSGRVNGGHDGMDCDLGQGSKEWVVCLDWGGGTDD